VNTLEGYMHPRVLAFALGALALAGLLHRKPAAAAALIAAALVTHPTTGAWFGIVAWTALLVSEPRWRPWMGATGLVALLLAAWTVSIGPLSSRLAWMDADWLAVLESRTYLFPDRWPLSEWLILALYVAVIAAVFRSRSSAGVVTPSERGIVAGVGVLLVILAASLPFNFARLALAVQLQVPRVLWIVDLLAVVYLVWWTAEGGRKAGGGGRKAGSGGRPAVAAMVILALALARGSYVAFVENPERALLQVELPDTDWNRALRWVSERTARDVLVLAHPGHAWRHGTSVRIGAKRDVVLEEVKDTALAMYSRETALRVLDRIRALANFDALTSKSARELSARYQAGLLITTDALELPLLHSEGPFRIYGLDP
jgi:hypothetical protein